MGFQNKLKQILDKEESEKMPKKEPTEMISRTCANFWCKGSYTISTDDLKKNFTFYSTCPKCRSFNTELSGGVTNNGQKIYSGDRFDNTEHEVTIKEHQVGFRR